ncbi:mucin-2-like isoform X2 [Halichondria panicea]|uniref:mucin-2-like isoform X2 n=1 Tax=Halichondria panicea TaxID=6063 RepID=UPI00312B9C35
MTHFHQLLAQHKLQVERSIVQRSLPCLARDFSQAIKENIDTAHSKDIPTCTRTSDVGSRCDLPQTTSTPHARATVYSSQSPPVTSSHNTREHTDTVSPQSPNTLLLTVGSEARCHDRPTYKKPVRKPRLSVGTKKTVQQNITSSQPEPTKHDNSLLETTLNISLPCDLLPSSRLTRSKTAFLRQQELASPSQPPAKKRRTIKKDESCTPDKCPSVFEVAAVSRSKAKSSSPNQPFVECTTTPSQSPLMSVPQDQLCDLFSRPLPERQSLDSAPTHSHTDQRRIISSAARDSQGEVLDYCLFNDVDDIFM